MPLLLVCVQPRSDRESKGPGGGSAWVCIWVFFREPEPRVHCASPSSSSWLSSCDTYSAPNSFLQEAFTSFSPIYRSLPSSIPWGFAFIVNPSPPPWSEPHSLVCICFSNYFLVVRVSFVPEKTQRPLDMASCWDGRASVYTQTNPLIAQMRKLKLIPKTECASLQTWSWESSLLTSSPVLLRPNLTFFHHT